MADPPDDGYERVREGIARYWANVTPEELAERQLRSNETRRRNAQQLKEYERQRMIDKQEEWERRHRSRLKKQAREAERKQRAQEGAVQQFLARTTPPPGATYFSETTKGRLVQVPGWRGVDPQDVSKRWDKFFLYVDSSGGPDACWPWHGASWYQTDYGAASWLGSLMLHTECRGPCTTGSRFPPGGWWITFASASGTSTLCTCSQ